MSQSNLKHVKQTGKSDHLSTENEEFSLNQKHPFFIELIADEIAKNLDLQSLKSFRQVCKALSKTLFKIFESQCVLNLKFNVIDKSISDFTDLFETAFENERIFTSIIIPTPKHLENCLLGDWLMKHGKHIVNLQLGSLYNSNNRPHNTMTKRRELMTIKSSLIFNVLCVWCVKLKHLTITALILDKEGMGRILIHKKQYAKLSSLVVGSKLESDMETSNMVEAVARLVIGLSSQVDSLTINGQRNTQQLITFVPKLIEKRQFFIKELHMESYLVHPEALTKMSKMDLKTLKVLSIGRINFSETLSNSIPVNLFLSSFGENLEKLSLHLGFPSEEDFGEPLLLEIEETTLKKLVALKNLTIDLSTWALGTIDKVMEHLVNCSDLTVICCERKSESLKTFIGDNVAAKANRRLESITFEGEVYLDKEDLEEVVHCFPNLKTLITVMTSFDQIDLLSSLKFLQNLKVVILYPNKYFPKELHKLKALKNLTLSIKLPKYQTGVNDLLEFTVDNLQTNFLPAPALKKLTLEHFKLSEGAFTIIKERSNGLQVKFNKCVIAIE